MSDSVASEGRIMPRRRSEPDKDVKEGEKTDKDVYNWKVSRRKAVLRMEKVTTVDEVHAAEDASEIRGFTISNDKLGDSYLASLYRSKDSRDGKDVIVKAIVTDGMDPFQDAHLRRNTYKILWFLHKTSYKNMANIYDWFNLNNKSLIIVEEYLTYSLSKVVQSVGSLKEKELKRYAEGLAEAVNFLHVSGISHQNVCARNVYVIPTNKQVKLSAVEYAIIYWDGEKDELYPQQLKTDLKPGLYIAPEITDGHTYDPTKADVYSYGTVLYYMAIGRYPCDSSRKSSFDEQWTRSTQEFEKVMSPLGKDLASKCVKHDPTERIDIREVVVHPWFAEGSK